MTNEQAIEVINGHIKDSSVAYGTFTGQALHMAVEALKAQLSEEGTTKDTTSDAISRQAAIDVFNTDAELFRRALDNTDIVGVERAKYEWCIDLIELYIDDMKKLPPAQPKQRTGKWTLGFDNRYMEKYYYCSCCGCQKYEEHEPLDYFCSNCGAKMIEK